MYIFQLERELLRKQVKTYTDKYVSGKVLNVGSGTSERYPFQAQASEYVRMDIVPGPNVDAVGRAEAIPFPDSSFDTVVSTQVFEHVENPELAAAEVSRVLKKGGRLVITVPQWNELHEEPHDYWRYTKFGLQALFERHGCRLMEMEQRGGYHAVRAQMGMRFAIDKWRLHSRPVLGRIASRIFKCWGGLAMWRDRKDASVANRKHAIGWCAVFQKL